MITQRYEQQLEVQKRIHIVGEGSLKFKFDKIFSNKGVQGIVGTLRFCDNRSRDNRSSDSESSDRVVFKMSNDINFVIEHETNIFKELNKLNLPHFVKHFSTPMMSINKYFLDNQQLDMFAFDSSDIVKRKAILMENIPTSDTFYNIVKNHKNNINKKRIIISQILQILISLFIAQNVVSFTHYDLHMDNILEMKCETNSVIIYDLSDFKMLKKESKKEPEKTPEKSLKYLIPTFGFYPVLIDFGMSYVDEINKYNLYSDISNYNHGAQSVIFDPLNDIHHLLVSTFYYIEDCNLSFEKISIKLQNIFSNLPILRKRGWKRLPHNFMKKVSSQLRKIKLYRYHPELLEIETGMISLLSTLVKLPLTDKKIDVNNQDVYIEDEGGSNYVLSDKFLLFFDVFVSLLPKKYTHFDSNILTLLKVVISSIIISTKDTFNKVFINKIFKEKINFITFTRSQVDLLYEYGIDVSLELSRYYKYLIDEHIDIINTGYLKIKRNHNIESLSNFINYFGKNFTPYFNFDKETIVYLYKPGQDSGYLKSYTCKNLTEEDLNRINNSTFTERADVVQTLVVG